MVVGTAGATVSTRTLLLHMGHHHGSIEAVTSRFHNAFGDEATLATFFSKHSCNGHEAKDRGRLDVVGFGRICGPSTQMATFRRGYCFHIEYPHPVLSRYLRRPSGQRDVLGRSHAPDGHHQAKPTGGHVGEGKGREVRARHCQGITLANHWQTKNPFPPNTSSDPTGGITQSSPSSDKHRQKWIGHIGAGLGTGMACQER